MACAAPELRVALQAEYENNVVQEARIAQLEDELSVARAETITAYDTVKPPVNIDTSTKTIVTGGTGDGDIQLPDPQGAAARSSALAVVSVVLGVLGVLLAVWKLTKKGKG